MKKLIILLSAILIFIVVSCDGSVDKQLFEDARYLVCESNIDSISSTKGIGNQGKYVKGVLFAENEGNKVYSLEDNYLTMTDIRSEDIFYLYYLGTDTITSSLGVECNYVLFYPGIIPNLFQNETGRRDTDAAFWWYLYTYLNAKPNDEASWNSLLSKLLNTKKLPYPKAKNIDSSLKSAYPELDKIIPWDNDWYDEHKGEFEVIGENCILPSVYIIDAYANNLGNLDYGYAKALLWYLYNYKTDLFPRDSFPTQDSIYSYFLNNRTQFLNKIDGLVVNGSDLTSPTNVPKEMITYSASEYLAIPAIKTLKKANKIALQQVTAIGCCEYNSSSFPEFNGEIRYSYRLSPAGFVQGVTIFYPDTTTINNIRNQFKDKGAEPVSGGSELKWIDLFVYENVVAYNQT